LYKEAKRFEQIFVKINNQQLADVNSNAKSLIRSTVANFPRTYKIGNTR